MPLARNNRWNSNTKPIWKVSALASILGEPLEDLIAVANNSEAYWKEGRTLIKPDGSLRKTSDAKPKLKQIHQKINSRILKQINYPQFLFGGIADPEKPRSTKTNATTHTGATTLIKEDIENFFPSISDDLVKRVWKYFFNYSEDVANILVKLTTYRGSTPQGWKTTGYIANLVFWNSEPKLVESLSRKGLAYSRWVDDICVSAKRKLSTSEKTQVINSIYGMMHSQGFKPKRNKHKILNKSKPMIVTGLLVNSATPRLPVSKRNNLRARIYRLETDISAHPSRTFRKEWLSIASQVGVLKKLDIRKGTKLRKRLVKVKPES